MRKDQIETVNEHRTGATNYDNPHLYPETLYIGAVYKSQSEKYGEVADHPFVLVESGNNTKWYLLVSLKDGNPAPITHSNDVVSPTPHFEFGVGTKDTAARFVGAEGDFIGKGDGLLSPERKIEKGFGFQKESRNGNYVTEYELRRFMTEHDMEKVAGDVEQYYTGK